MKRVICWLRRVYPPWWAAAFVLAVYVALETVFWWARGLDVPLESLTEVLRVRDVFMSMAAGAYAIFRVAAFHPFFRPNYRRWLEQTPWTSATPLPLGPVHLVVQDLLMIGMMRILLHDCQFQETLLPQVFLFHYLTLNMLAVWGTGERTVAYVVAFGAGLAILAHWWAPLASVACLIGCYLLVAVGIQRSLRHFPWTTSMQMLERLWRETQTNQPPHKQRVPSWNELQVHPGTLGWPYNLINAKTDQPITSLTDRVVISILAGWILFSITACPDTDSGTRLGGVSLVLGYVTFGLVFGRLLLYCMNHWPPISLWGRLWTGRWIIAAYDRVFVAPLLTAGVGWGGLLLVAMLPDGDQTWFAPMSGGVLSLTMIIATALGPKHQRWRLTAPCRTGQIQPGARMFERI